MNRPPPLSRQQMQQVAAKAREGITIATSAKALLARAGCLGQHEQEALKELLYAAERALGDAWGIFVQHGSDWYKAQEAAKPVQRSALPPVKPLMIGFSPKTDSLF